MREAVGCDRTLLQMLRENHIHMGFYPTGGGSWEEEESRTFRLLLDHRAEFPLRIRTAIEGSLPTDTEGLLAPDRAKLERRAMVRLRMAVSAYLFGTVQTRAGMIWRGPNSRVDTEDQIEATIRMFPGNLQMKLVYDFLKFPEALSFVPLLARLQAEKQWFHKRKRIGNHWKCHGTELYVLERLLVNHLAEERTEETDEASLEALVRLRDEGFVVEKLSTEINRKLVLRWLFRQGQSSGRSFVERRLRLLIEWVPAFVVNHRDDGSIAPGDLFLHSCFSKACSTLGTELVLALVRDALVRDEDASRTRDVEAPHGRCSTRQEMVRVAASEDKFRLDVVYTLVRSDPLAVFPKSPFPGR